MVSYKSKSALDILFLLLVYFIVITSTVVCLIPFLRVVSEAFSNPTYVASGDIWFWPIDFTFENIMFIFNTYQFRNSMVLSIITTIIFTVGAMVLTVLLSYPLSRKYLPKSNAMMFFVAFTMMFNGGIIPTYMVVNELGMINTIAALIFPMIISAFNVVILVNSMRAVPIDYEEAALIEGAGYFTILMRVMIPLVKPTIAVLVLYYAVSRWNGWFDALMYINNQDLFILPVLIRSVLERGNSALSYSLTTPPPTIAIQSAAVIFSILPILALYPMLQKYFTKGIMLGGIKG